jgi:nicotinamidase-related amidase
MPLFPLVVSTRDWHPPGHVSFKARGGPWPPHCVQRSRGAELHPGLRTERIANHFSKAFDPDKDAYSEFEGIDSQGRSLDQYLRELGILELYVVGLATDYCVRATVLDGLRLGYQVHPVIDATRAVEVAPGDGARAIEEMIRNGAQPVTSDELLPREQAEAVVSS